MKSTINPYDISGLGASVLISSPEIVTKGTQDRNFRKEEMLAILMKPVGVANIPIETRYGNILTSMENLVEVAQKTSDILDAVPYQYVLELASKAGISLPPSDQLLVQQKIAEGKGALSHNDRPTSATLIDTTKMIVKNENGIVTFHEPKPEVIEDDLDTMSASITTPSFSNSTRLIIGLVALAAVGGTLWAISSNSKKSKPKDQGYKKTLK
ncbi:hypothetical protein MASR2M41_26770 [Flammeovirgaceae bacterium]